MRTMIICQTPQKGMHSFYAIVNNKSYFLFSQDFRHGVHDYFENGVSLNEAINHSKAHNDSAILRTMSKLPMYIKLKKNTTSLCSISALQSTDFLPKELLN